MKKPTDFDQTPSGETAKRRNPHHVQVGDIWQDNDPRHQAGGTLTPASDKRYRNGTPSRIRLSRFKPTSTGYRKVT